MLLLVVLLFKTVFSSGWLINDPSWIIKPFPHSGCISCYSGAFGMSWNKIDYLLDNNVNTKFDPYHMYQFSGFYPSASCNVFKITIDFGTQIRIKNFSIISQGDVHNVKTFRLSYKKISNFSSPWEDWESYSHGNDDVYRNYQLCTNNSCPPTSQYILFSVDETYSLSQCYQTWIYQLGFFGDVLCSNDTYCKNQEYLLNFDYCDTIKGVCVENDLRPLCSFSWFPNGATVVSNVLFTDTSIPNLMYNSSIVSYHWEAGELGNSTGNSFSLLFTTIGFYNITLTVIDEESHLCTVTHSIEVCNSSHYAMYSCHKPPHRLCDFDDIGYGGFYFDQPSGECLPCSSVVPHCVKCENPLECTLGNCENTVKCEQCTDAYYLDDISISGECALCSETIDYCVLCENASSCHQCHNSYSVSPTGLCTLISDTTDTTDTLISDTTDTDGSASGDKSEGIAESIFFPVLAGVGLVSCTIGICVGLCICLFVLLRRGKFLSKKLKEMEIEMEEKRSEDKKESEDESSKDEKQEKVGQDKILYN